MRVVSVYMYVYSAERYIGFLAQSAGAGVALRSSAAPPEGTVTSRRAAQKCPEDFGEFSPILARRGVSHPAPRAARSRCLLGPTRPTRDVRAHVCRHSLPTQLQYICTFVRSPIGQGLRLPLAGYLSSAQVGEKGTCTCDVGRAMLSCQWQALGRHEARRDRIRDKHR